MSLKKLGNNETEVTQYGFAILYSYNTPVAIRHIETGKEWRTNKKWSATTSKHLSKWCNTGAEFIDQKALENMIKNSESTEVRQ